MSLLHVRHGKLLNTEGKFLSSVSTASWELVFFLESNLKQSGQESSFSKLTMLIKS